MSLQPPEHSQASKPAASPVPNRAAHHDQGYGAIWFVIVLLIIGGSGGGYWWYRRTAQAATAATQPAQSQGPRASSVVAVTAIKADMPIYFTGLGSVTGLNTVVIRSRVDGQLEKVAYVEGQIVHEGDLLAQIDPRPFVAQLEQAQGLLAKDQAILDNARMDLERNKKAGEAITEQQLMTQASLVKQYEGIVKVDQAQIDSIQLQINYCKITAPFTGRIGLRLVDQGNMIHASDAGGLAVLTQMQPVTLLFTLPQDNIPQIVKRVAQGTPLIVEAYDRGFKTRLASGTLLAVDNQVDPASGTIRLKSIFANDDGTLFPNQFVNARLLVDTRRNAVIVPTAAIQQGPSFSFAYVVKSDSTVEVREITVGPVEGEMACIDSGLEADEIVVTDGVDKLQAGSKVTLRTEGKNSAGAKSEGKGEKGGKSGRKPKETTQPATAGGAAQ